MLVRACDEGLNTNLGIKWCGFSSHLCDLRRRITLLINVDYCVMFELWGFQDLL